jgi:hypothetical protein
MKNSERIRAFNYDEFVLERLDLDRTCRPELESRRVNVDFHA